MKISALIALVLFAVLPSYSGDINANLVRASLDSETDLPWQIPANGGFNIFNLFKEPETKYGAGHRGIDFNAILDEPVFSPTNAQVFFNGKVADRGVLTLETANGLLISFESLDSDLIAGTEVFKGEILGKISVGAHCSSNCLHVGVRQDGRYLNPLRFFLLKPRLLRLAD